MRNLILKNHLSITHLGLVLSLLVVGCVTPDTSQHITDNIQTSIKGDNHIDLDLIRVADITSV